MFLICYRVSQVLYGMRSEPHEISILNMFVEKIVKLKGNRHFLARILNVSCKQTFTNLSASRDT